ncbi:class I SAM-dependent methyltransferase [Fodinicola acaciae]|uniref:class I SAM-dependent methyltransferase n=1 Tax=Fodinicola acaciae TaxID=2681555 RepID=UPI0013CF4169|nr:class I SAM-dependent methyltransferase [Fodinicola acaciae]
MTEPDPDSYAREIAAESLAADDPTGWFERLYADAAGGTAVVPWDRGQPNRFLVPWTEKRWLRGDGRTAVVVGCGFGADAEHLASLGFETTAFDIAPTAVRDAAARHPRSSVRYQTADLLDLPPGWRFDLVLESMTVQSMPLSLRDKAIAGVRSLVAPGGTLLVIAAGREDGEPLDGPPWPLTRAELDAFAVGLSPVRIEEIREPDVLRWRAEFIRPA